MADQNIDLGSISWDLSAIDKQLIDNRKALEGNANAVKKNKEELQKQRKEIQETAATIELCNEMQQELNKSLQEGAISEAEYVEATAAVSEEIQQARDRTAELVQSQSELIQSNINLEQNTRDLQRETRTLNTLRAAGREEAYEEVGAYQALNDELNALKRESKDIGATLVQMKRNGEENTEAYKALEERYRTVTEQAEQLNNEFVNLDQAVGDNQRNVGNYTESIKNAFAGISEGFGKMMSGDFKGGMDEIKTGLGDVKNGAKDLFATLAANPWLAVLTVIVGGVIAYTKAMIDHNKYIDEANGKVESLARTTGDLTDELRRAGQAITDTFTDKSFEDAVTEMDALMDDFKISSQEAFDIYVDGLVRGGAANDEFGDSIKEYGALFAQNGYSAQQFLNILNAGVDLGIYSDKLPDAIKEAGLALREQTKPTRDALVNAFGAPFTDELLRNVQTGRSTVAKALDDIADKSEEVNLNQQQQAQLTADLFKGAGEDAGGSLMIFKALNQSQGQTYDNLTELQKQTLSLSKLNLALQNSKDEAFANDSVRAFRREFDVTWIAIQAGWYKALAGGAEFFQFLSNQFRFNIMNIVDGFKLIPKVFREVAFGIGQDIAKLGQAGVTAGRIVKEAFSLDLEGAGKAYEDLKKQLTSFNSSTLSSLSKIDGYVSEIATKNAKLIKAQTRAKVDAQKAEDEAAKRAEQNAQTVAEREAAAKAAAEAKKKAEAEAKATESKRIAENKKAVADQKKLVEELAKRELEILRDRASQATEIAKGELAEYIRLNAEKYKDDKSLTERKLQDQIAYFDEVAKRQREANRLEKESKELAIQQKINEIKQKTEYEENGIKKKRELNATELKEVENLKNNISILNQQYIEADAELDRQTKEKQKELNTKFEEEVAEQKRLSRAIAFQQELIDLETKGATEFEIRRAQLQRDRDLQIEEFLKKNELLRELDQEEYDLESETKLARQELEAEMQIETDANERLRIQNQLDELAVIEGRYAENVKQMDKAVNDAKIQGLQGAFGQAKGLFKENTLAYKAMAIAEATISTYLSATKALAEVPYPVNYVVAGINIATGLANVAKIVGIKGFSKGGYTGSGSIDEVAGIVHKGEVVFSQADVQALGGASVVDAMRPTAGGYFGSSVGVSNLPSVQSAMMGGNIVVMLDENSVSLVADAVYSGSQAGIGDMANNSAIRQGANF